MVFSISLLGARPVGEMAEAAGNGVGTPLPVGLVRGFTLGTRVATGAGCRAVELLEPGDCVLTVERGAQPVRRIERGYLWQGPSACPPPLWPLEVPAGTLGNRRRLTLLPEQRVLIGSALAAKIHGTPFALLPARLLDGVMGIRRVAPPAGEAVGVVSIAFDAPGTVRVNGAALVQCPSWQAEGAGAADRPEDPRPGAPRCGITPGLEEARRIVAALEGAHAGAAIPPRLPMVRTVPLLDALLRHAA
ncbi:Hint domain-containing protein [Rhodovulum sp. YEN HP10]|uniref:Hint domain-containing protein n=1 Tax=Rhodovulum sp. HP10 TaxID=3387397 RepID=UPI0039E1DEC6